MKKRAWTALVLAVTAALCACASPSEPETPEEGTLIYFLAPEDAVWGGDRVQGSWENLDLPEDAPSLDTARAVVARLLAGEDCALVTDAGTPAISDPGEDLVALCAGAGVAV